MRTNVVECRGTRGVACFGREAERSQGSPRDARQTDRHSLWPGIRGPWVQIKKAETFILRLSSEDELEDDGQDVEDDERYPHDGSYGMHQVHEVGLHAWLLWHLTEAVMLLHRHLILAPTHLVWRRKR